MTGWWKIINSIFENLFAPNSPEVLKDRQPPRKFNVGDVVTPKKLSPYCSGVRGGIEYTIAEPNWEETFEEWWYTVKPYTYGGKKPVDVPRHDNGRPLFMWETETKLVKKTNENLFKPVTDDELESRGKKMTIDQLMTMISATPLWPTATRILDGAAVDDHPMDETFESANEWLARLADNKNKTVSVRLVDGAYDQGVVFMLDGEEITIEIEHSVIEDMT